MATARLLFATCFFTAAVATPPCQDAAACQALADFDILHGKHDDEGGLSLLQLQAQAINVVGRQDPLDFDISHGDQDENEGLSLLQRQAQTVNAAPVERIRVPVHELSVPDHFALAVPPKAPEAPAVLPKTLEAAPPKRDDGEMMKMLIDLKEEMARLRTGTPAVPPKAPVAAPPKAPVAAPPKAPAAAPPKAPVAAPPKAPVAAPPKAPVAAPPKAPVAAPPKAPVAAPPKAPVAAPPKAPAVPPKAPVAAPPKAPVAAPPKAPVTVPPQGNGIVPVTVPLTAKPPPVYTTKAPSSVGMSGDQFPPSGTPTPEPGQQGNFNPAGVPISVSDTVVVPAPFNAPAPAEQSLIDWWRPGGKWLSQVISYTQDRGGMAINPEDAVPTPAPPPYWRGRFGTPKPPMVNPITETKQQFAAQQKADAQDWRDCTVAEWSAWSICGAEHPPNEVHGDHQVRYREVTTPHSRFGAPCPPQSEVIECVPGGPLFSVGR